MRTGAIARTPRGAGFLALPYVAGLAVLVGFPALVTLILAFFRADLVSRPRFVGFANFAQLFDDDVFRIALRNSLGFVFWSVPVRVVGAAALGLLLHVRARGTAFARTSVLLPTVMPDVAYALVWLWILNPLYGPLNQVLEALGLGAPAWLSRPVAARAAVILMSLFQLGEGFLLAIAARRMVPGELEEVAIVEGAGAWQRFLRLTFPLMLPALLLLTLRDTIFALQVTFVPALIVTEGGPPPYATTYLPLFVYRHAFEYLRYGYAAAATLVMLVVTAAIVWLQYQIMQVRLNRSLLGSPGRVLR